ncbi:hypothetical protein BDV23DRAFT_171054 [Aspergillus alliaceus]|uniref:LysM domain-containing protein n=1 Tax=Petromyces alliaceus TaxID=209559 RepID=A0A5N7CDW7_PETAA|nr:hypothetical protein BDV23DRAFT_171054 [Aspergillus alliaceus]
MIFAHILGLSLLGSVNAATLGKRFSSANFAIGETDPHVSSECTYWANSIKSTDTCAALERYYGISNAHLVSWNPSLQATDYALSEGWSYCVEASAIATTTKTTIPEKTTSEKTTTTTKAPATTPSNFTTSSATKSTVGGPSPTQTGLTSSCNAFYYVQKDDSCWATAAKTNCSGLQPNYYVCVGVVGSTAPIITSKTATASPTTTTAPHSPQQSGISSDCNNYYFVEAGDERAFIAAKHGITLRSTCGSLQAGYWVYIGVEPPQPTTQATTAKTTTGTAPASTRLSPTQSGIITDCSAYYQAQGGDNSWPIVNKKYSYLTAAKFYEWNPAIGTSCTNTSTQFGSWNPYVGSSCATLWQGYYVCVGV